MADARLPDTLIFRDLNVAPIPPTAPPHALEPAAASAVEPAPPVAAATTTPQPPAAPAPVAAAGPAAGAAAAPAKVQLLQIATMPDLAGARRLQQELRGAGFDAYLEPVRTSTGEVYRVRVAVDTSRRTAADAVAELKRLGYQPIPVQR
jgi:cell division septation protein DedD